MIGPYKEVGRDYRKKNTRSNQEITKDTLMLLNDLEHYRLDSKYC